MPSSERLGEGDELGRCERFRPVSAVAPERGERYGHLVPLGDAGQLERIRQRLPPMGERRGDERFHTSCTSTETAPYAFVLGAANKRSATSRWTITHQDSIPGSPSRLSTISGVATLYGKLETSFVASCGSSIRSASPKRRQTFSPMSRRCGSSDRSISTAYTRATR